ncbi:ATP-dependent helicase HrpB [Saccharobesus litoralis]|uniref:ATP-dependent helicase HrpB n=1 Tax=Saccharobesus litoralis TaxID=2172099 RepID=A0A2S0VS68_9ALTE|nr:ATP-dependent helicase HrpB [Saccharobesus litoralis]AWB67047.1 ATP-dependent helicase HrpB [Saccharobesus litoralis]
MLLLPIESSFSEIKQAISLDNQLIIQAPPGAGKSTWLPLQLLTQNVVAGKILLLEPRRVAARSVANYMSSCLNEKVGETIGLRMRGQTQVSAATRLEVVTEGVLTRMLQSDPELSGYDLILFDEFHERSLQADMAFAFAYEVQQGLRDDLKLVLMSATLDLPLAQKILPAAKLIQTEGRQFPVEVAYRPMGRMSWQDKLIQVVREALDQQGNILVFLPGIGEINRAQRALMPILPADIVCQSLHGQLALNDQQQILSLDEQGRRKLVLSTNIAETSLTIPGIKIVIDCGTHKRVRFNPKNGFSTLFTERISQASAEQRKGRAGRIEAGIAYRLWSRDEQQRMRTQYPAEIETADISEVYLELLNWGAQSFTELNWPTLPSDSQINLAISYLKQQGLITEQLGKNKLTLLGQRIASQGLPIDIALVRQQANYSSQVLAAWLFEQMPRGQVGRDDINVINQIQSSYKYYSNIKGLLKRWRTSDKYTPNHIIPDELVQAALVAYPMRVAKKRGAGYLMASGTAVSVPAESHISQDIEFILVLGASFSDKQASGVIRQYLALTKQNVAEYIEPAANLTTHLEINNKSGQLQFYEVVRYGNLELDKRLMTSKPSTQQLQQAWLEYIQNQGFKEFKQCEKLQQLLARLRLANQINSTLFPSVVTSDELQNNAQHWFGLHLTQIKNLQQLLNLDLISCVTSGLQYEQQSWLKQALPSQWQTQDGNHYRLDYAGEHPVKTSLRLQSCYGIQQHPCVADGKIAITLELLSPAQRPIQTTNDINSFWLGSYKDVQKDMKSRYPKHFWPDEPQHAEPGLQTKRQRTNS